MPSYPDKLEEEFRRQIYTFVLSVYELSGSVKQPGVLIKDIEAVANKFLIAVAKYPALTINPHTYFGSLTREEQKLLAKVGVGVKDKVIKDILGELKGLKALLGAARDTGLINRERFRPVWEESVLLEDKFSGILNSGKSRAAQNSDDTIADRLSAAPGLSEVLNEPKAASTLSNVSGIPKVSKVPNVLSEAPNVPNLRKVSNAPNVLRTGSHEERQDVSLRQTAILEVLKRRNRVTVGELGALFSGRVSKKTLQRDLQDLADRSIVKRTGEKRWAAYSLNS